MADHFLDHLSLRQKIILTLVALLALIATAVFAVPQYTFPALGLPLP